ncbi:MAG: DUF4292 domain-containing protein, partial [Chitinophagaceae bacterium]
MKIKFLLVFLLSATWFACRPVKKVQVIQAAIEKKDTAQKVIIKETPTVDSAALIAEITKKVFSNTIDFNTLNAKIKVDYEGQGESQHPTVYLSMRKDSIIFIQVVGNFLGITARGLEVKITPDSVVLIKEFGEKWIKYRSLTYLKEVTEIPFDFKTLQDLLVGNLIFTDKSIAFYKENADNLLVMMVGKMFKHLITLDTQTNLVTHSKLDDIDVERNRTCDITLANYAPIDGFKFSTYR